MDFYPCYGVHKGDGVRVFLEWKLENLCIWRYYGWKESIKNDWGLWYEEWQMGVVGGL